MDYSIPMRPREPRYYDEDYPPDPYASRDPRRSNSHGAGRDASPPRRQKSQRHRRAPSLDAYPEDPYDSRRSGGGSSRRHHGESSPMAAGASRRYASPEPRARHSSRREPAAGANRDYYERDAPRGGGRYRSPSPEPRRRQRHHDDFDAGVRRSRTMPQGDPGYGYDPRGRAQPPPPYDDRDAQRRRRPASNTRGGYDRDPSPRRGRPPPSGATKAARPSARRNSMPAATTKNGKPWWQNPLLQAGARAALTTGAQAAMRSRDDPSPWLGAKGAKVATAALGAAFVDGFIGKKHPGGVRHNVMSQGIDMAAAYAAKGAAHEEEKHRRHRSSSRRRR